MEAEPEGTLPKEPERDGMQAAKQGQPHERNSMPRAIQYTALQGTETEPQANNLVFQASKSAGKSAWKTTMEDAPQSLNHSTQQHELLVFDQ
ncbi:UNVERIFIED_CONTAM: hypothetical protein Slati_0145500 [Sesamum latifolium]|uniref:Uncharacterized protein n=1 Tax=Sesamum latifolium TaxID=2727402 RepID=A0AAW2Y9V3_9LAMI